MTILSDLPNHSPKNETCANICNAMLSYRMLGIHGESKYADIVELVMYNRGLSGISVNGKLSIYYLFQSTASRPRRSRLLTTCDGDPGSQAVSRMLLLPA